MLKTIKTVCKTRKEAKKLYNEYEINEYIKNDNGYACAFVSGIIDGTKQGLAIAGAIFTVGAVGLDIYMKIHKD